MADLSQTFDVLVAGGGNAEMNVKDVSYALISANGGCSIYAEVVSAVAGVVVLI